MQASYQHRYGVFIRLVLMTGIRLGELLGLQWCDVDFRARMLHIRRTLNRLQKRDVPTDDVSPRTEIVIQESKTENSIRDIPLLAPVVADLLNWRKMQEQDREAYICIQGHGAGDGRENPICDSGALLRGIYHGYLRSCAS